MKYLILDFKDAGWFSTPNMYSKDFYNSCGVYFARKGLPQYKEPITYHQISGMLHVLLGERPKPSLRSSVIEEIPEILELAKNSFIKITSFYKYETINGNEIIAKESFRERKSVWNSYSKTQYLCWRRIENYLEPELYAELLDITKQLLGVSDITTITLDNALKQFNLITNNEILESFKLKLKSKGKTDFSCLLTNSKYKVFRKNKKGKDVEVDNSNRVNINMNAKTLVTVPAGVIEITKLSGKIIVPIDSESILNKLRNYSTGLAKLLDGGLVTIDSIKSGNTFSSETDLVGFTKVGDISDEYLVIEKKK